MMRLVKASALALSGLIIMITLLSLFIPSRVLVSRGVAIHSSAKKVYNAIAVLRNWKTWHPVFKDNPSEVAFSKDSTGVNSSCEWESNGKKNKLLVITQAENEISLSLQRPGETNVLNTITILPLADSNSVQVEWKALTRLKWYPWEKLYGVFIEKVTGQGYEDALNSLKAVLDGH